MYIIVIGGGKIGYYLSKALLSEGHEVLIIEENAGICEEINDELGSISLRGDGCETATLMEAGTERADIVIAVTGDDEDNLVACQVSKHKFNVPRTMARIKNPQNEEVFNKLGIDVTISSTNLILEHISEDIPTHALTHLLVIEEHGLEIVEVKVPAEAKITGKMLKDLALPPENKLTLIVRADGSNLIPGPDTMLLSGDRIIALTTHNTEEALRAALTGE